jgi:DNA polymerase-4
MERLDQAGTTGKTITVKVKFADFRQVTRSKTLQKYIRDFETLHREVSEIRRSMKLESVRIRLLGVSISHLESEADEEVQLHLFDDEE